MAGYFVWRASFLEAAMEAVPPPATATFVPLSLAEHKVGDAVCLSGWGNRQSACRRVVASDCDKPSCASCGHCRSYELCKRNASQAACHCSTDGEGAELPPGQAVLTRVTGRWSSVLLGERLPVLGSDFCLLPDLHRRVHDGSSRISVMMDRYRRGRTFGLVENKLLAHSLLKRMGLPVVPVLYGAFLRRALGEWPRYDRTAFKTAIKGRTSNFVIKPTTDGQNNGVLVMTTRKWVDEGWSATRLADHVERLMANATDWGQLRAHHGVIVQESATDLDKLDATSPLVLEATVHVVWGKLSSGYLACVPRVKLGDSRKIVCLNPHAPAHSSGRLFFKQGNGQLDLGATVAASSRDIHALERAKEQLMAAARHVGTLIGADWFRLDAFIAEEGSGLPTMRVNEITYPSNLEAHDFRDLDRLRKPYEDGLFQPVLSRVLLSPLVKSIGVALKDL